MMAIFRSEDGSTITSADLRDHELKYRIVERDGKRFRRVPKEKPKSRQTRLNEVISTLGGIRDELQTIAETVERDAETLTNDDTRQARESAENWLSDFDGEKGEVETLKDEIEEWKGNMEGTNLENTDKFTEVSECADALENLLNEMDDIGTIEGDNPEALAESVKEAVEKVDNVISEAENISFPGAFGR